MTHGSNDLHFWYDAQNRPAIVAYNGTKYAYIYNLQGDVLGLIDSTGTEVVKYTYDAWGKVLSATGSLASSLGIVQPFRYRGYVFDVETGLYYLRSRYYNPGWQRFVNADTLIMGNLFSYCDNSPIKNHDPSGKLYVALELYTVSLSVEDDSHHDFSNTIISSKMTERLITSNVFNSRVAKYIRSIPVGKTSYSNTEHIFWGFSESLKKMSMPDLDLALSVGNATDFTVTVEKVEKSWFESLLYWGEKYKVTYTLNDYYDFEEWAGTDRSDILIWLNDELGYNLQQEGIIHKYYYTITDEYFVYAYY